MSNREAMQRLRERGLAPKKSFGQNFLHNAALCDRIAALAVEEPGGSVLEIGAGLGALTDALLQRADHVVAVERDRDLLPILQERFAAQPRLTLVEADAVSLDWLEQLRDRPKPHFVAGNLPYQITGRLMRNLGAVSEHIDGAVVMVQREVALRLCAGPGQPNYGALSVFIQAAFEARAVLKVGAGSFTPAPKVESTVVRLRPLRPPKAHESALFRELVKRAFGQRRKRLRNAWKGIAGLSVDTLAEVAATAEIDLTVRGETLGVEEFARMARALEQLP